MKLGLDFGTTNSAVSLYDGNKVTLLPIDLVASNPAVIRSALYFFPRKVVISEEATEEQLKTNSFNIDQISYEGKVKTLIGASAVKQYLNDNTFKQEGILRRIYTGKTIRVITWTDTNSGKVYTDDIPQVMEEMDYGTGRLFHALKTGLKFRYYTGSTVFGDFYSLEDLIGLFLNEIKDKVEEKTGQKIKELTVGRPVYFSKNQEIDSIAQDRLLKALGRAGISKITFEYEPIGAAKYFLHQNPSIRGKILVFDFGGGTLDTTIIEKSETSFKVLTTDGVYIGGDLLNSDIFSEKLGSYFGSKVVYGENKITMPHRITESLSSWFSISNLNNPDEMKLLDEIQHSCNDPEAIKRLIYLVKANLGFEIYEAIEVAKKNLSSFAVARIKYRDGPIDINVKLTREEFEELIDIRLQEVKHTVLKTLNNISLEPQKITAVVATGGSSLMPCVKNMLSSVFGNEKIYYFETFTSIAAGLVL